MSTADSNNTYRRHTRLADALPPLVRKQRTLAGKVAPLEKLVEDEKKVRAEIDQLLLACGFAKGEGVTCNGYDVVHRERKGNTSYDVVLLGQVMVTKLCELGMRREDLGKPGDEGYMPGAETFVVEALAAVRSVGDTSKWAEVNPMKGAKVRAA